MADIPIIRTKADLARNKDRLLTENSQVVLLTLLDILSHVLPDFDDPPETHHTQPPILNDTQNSFEEKERERSVVLSGVPESDSSDPSTRVASDFHLVRDILNFLHIECNVSQVYRMGRYVQGESSRLIKVVLPSNYHQRALLKSAKNLKSCVNQTLRNTFIRPSLTKTQRRQGFTLRQQRRALGENAREYVIDYTRLHLKHRTTGQTIPLDKTMYQELQNSNARNQRAVPGSPVNVLPANSQQNITIRHNSRTNSNANKKVSYSNVVQEANYITTQPPNNIQVLDNNRVNSQQNLNC